MTITIRQQQDDSSSEHPYPCVSPITRVFTEVDFSCTPISSEDIRYLFEECAVNIQELKLKYCTNFTHFDPSVECAKVEKLDCSYSSIETFHAGEALRHFEILIFTGCEKLTSLTFYRYPAIPIVISSSEDSLTLPPIRMPIKSPLPEFSNPSLSPIASPPTQYRRDRRRSMESIVPRQKSSSTSVPTSPRNMRTVFKRHASATLLSALANYKPRRRMSTSSVISERSIEAVASPSSDQMVAPPFSPKLVSVTVDGCSRLTGKLNISMLTKLIVFQGNGCKSLEHIIAKKTHSLAYICMKESGMRIGPQFQSLSRLASIDLSNSGLEIGPDLENLLELLYVGLAYNSKLTQLGTMRNLPKLNVLDLRGTPLEEYVPDWDEIRTSDN